MKRIHWHGSRLSLTRTAMCRSHVVTVAKTTEPDGDLAMTRRRSGYDEYLRKEEVFGDYFGDGRIFRHRPLLLFVTDPGTQPDQQIPFVFPVKKSGTRAERTRCSLGPAKMDYLPNNITVRHEFAAIFLLELDKWMMRVGRPCSARRTGSSGIRKFRPNPPRIPSPPSRPSPHFSSLTSRWGTEMMTGAEDERDHNGPKIL